MTSRNVHIIGGAGGIGRWFATHVFPDSYVYDVRFPNSDVLPRGARPCLLTKEGYAPYSNHFCQADWVLISTPLTVFEQTATAIIPLLKEGSLIVPLSSVQREPVEFLRANIPAGRSVCGCHPLFGHTLSSAVGQIVALTDFDERSTQQQRFRATLAERGMIPTALSLSEHELYMAHVQALTHFCLLGFAATLGR